MSCFQRGARKFQKEMTIAIKNAKDALRMGNKVKPLVTEKDYLQKEIYQKWGLM